MVPYHCSPDRALELRTELVPNGSAWPMPVLGTLLTTVGLLLFFAGLVDRHTLARHRHAPRLAAQPAWRRTTDDDPQPHGTASSMAPPTGYGRERSGERQVN